jgi:hypothetical protein
VGTWVYGPSIHGSVTGYGALNGKSLAFDYDLPNVCPTLQGDDATANYFSGTGQLPKNKPVEAWSWSITGKVNCLPHPTLDGQNAIASAFARWISP